MPDTPNPPPHWAISTHKGGCSKTLLTTLIAAAAADTGRRVLVIDMDAQANATRRLATPLPPTPTERSTASLAAILTRPRPGDAARIITPCGWPDPYPTRIDVAPGHLDLELLPATAATPGASRRLLVALTGVVDDYDLVLIDCPPSLRGHLVDLAWTATDVLWIPTEPEYDSIEAARRVIERVDLDRDLLNPDMQVGGLVVTRHRRSLAVHNQRAAETMAILPGGGCPWWIPERAALKALGELAAPPSALGAEGAGMRTVAQGVFEWMLTRASQIANRSTISPTGVL